MDSLFVLSYSLFLAISLNFSEGACATIQAITFTDSDLSRYDHQEIVFAGFLVNDQEGRSFLSPEPNLKTCCVGKSEQIALSEQFPKDLCNQLVKVKGTLLYDQRCKRYSIGNPILVKERRSFMFFGVGILSLIASLIFMAFKRITR